MQQNIETQAAQNMEAATKRVMSPAAKAALEASRARYDLAEALLTVMGKAVAEGKFEEPAYQGWIQAAENHLAAEKKRKAEEAEQRKLNSTRGVGLALYREKANAALNLMEMLKAAGIAEADIVSGKVTPADLAKLLAGGTPEPTQVITEEAESAIEEEGFEPEYDEEGNTIIS